MSTKIKPLHDRIVVRRVAEELSSPGGIVIPDTATEKPSRGVVVVCGPGKVLDNGQRQPLSLKEKDTVLFGKYSGTEVKFEGQEYVVMREEDVFAVIE